ARGNGRAAREHYRRAVELEPGRLAAYFSLIGQYREARDWKSALEWIDTALELDRHHPLLYAERAVACEKLGWKIEADSARRQAQRTYEAEVRYTRAAAARAVRKPAEAERLLRAAVESNPGLSKAWTDLGEILRLDHRTKEAREAFTMALEGDPEDARAHLGLAAALQDEGRDAEAMIAYRRALGHGLTSTDLYSALAAAYFDQGKLREAAAEMLRALRERPDDPDLLSYHGYLEAQA